MYPSVESGWLQCGKTRNYRLYKRETWQLSFLYVCKGKILRAVCPNIKWNSCKCSVCVSCACSFTQSVMSYVTK